MTFGPDHGISTETLNEELTWQGAMIPAILRPARTMLQLAHGADMGIEGLQLGRAPSWQEYGNRSNSFCHISALLLSRDPMHDSSPYVCLVMHLYWYFMFCHVV